MKKDVLINFSKLTGKHLCQSLFLNKVAGLKACNFIEKKSLAQVFSCEFCKICKNTFFQEHIRTTTSVFQILLLTKLFDISDFSLVETKHTTVIFL